MKNKTTFAYYGLDKDCNFLQAPMCECGCGHYANLVLEDDDDICGFMHAMLEEYECDHCAIFTVKDGDEVLMAIKSDEGVKCWKCMAEGRENLFKDIQDGFQFHCYGLLEQAGDNLYRIIMN